MSFSRLWFLYLCLYLFVDQPQAEAHFIAEVMFFLFPFFVHSCFIFFVYLSFFHPFKYFYSFVHLFIFS